MRKSNLPNPTPLKLRGARGQKSAQNVSKGKLGEKLAENFLRKKGYRIIDRNFYKRGGEIDLIATKNKTLIFVEVKTRIGDQFGKPEEAITSRKQKVLIRTAEYYYLLHPELPENHRLDVVAVELDEQKKLLELRHIENITG